MRGMTFANISAEKDMVDSIVTAFSECFTTDLIAPVFFTGFQYFSYFPDLK